MNWQALIAALEKLQMSQTQIADACQCAQTTISALATGKTLDPKHSTGESLKRLLLAKLVATASTPTELAALAASHGLSLGADYGRPAATPEGGAAESQLVRTRAARDRSEAPAAVSSEGGHGQ
jgi:transcriptional regulator with XRE-family HTH domain